MSLRFIADWAPLQIDALGIVTIFGAQEMDTAVGRLTSSWLTDWLPLLAGHTVAGNQMVQPRPGFVLYNVTDGIVATDVSSWFTRWLVTEPITYTASVIRLRTNGRPPAAYLRASSMLLGVSWLAALLAVAIAQEDYWGAANTAAMAVSVGVRQGMVGMLRGAVDHAIADHGEDEDHVKVFLTLPNGKAVTVLGSRMLVVDCLLTDPKPIHPHVYLATRILGWAAFGVHVIALGMSSLATQILAVVVLLVATIFKAYQIGDRPSAIGSLVLDFARGDERWTRKSAYIELDLEPHEEENMVAWNLMPRRSNKFWWERYHKAEEECRVKRLASKRDKTFDTFSSKKDAE